MKVDRRMKTTNVVMTSVALLLLVPFALFAKCPITPNGTLEIKAHSGNLLVDTSGTDSVDVEIQGGKITPQETCSRDRVIVTAAATPGKEIPDWKIRVPKGVALDLTALNGGSITVADTDGSVTLRTSGSNVTVGNVKGDAAIVTQGGRIKAGDIGGNAELKSQGGTLNVGNVGGKADLRTTGGGIVAGFVRGGVYAETGGGNIEIRESKGQIYAKTAGGSIITLKVDGPFEGHTDSGDIRVEQAGSWIHAFTGQGDISIKLAPENIAGDHHVDVETGLGNIVLFLPQKLKATIDAVIKRPAFAAGRFFSDFPSNTLVPMVNKVLPGGPERIQRELNGGGNPVSARTSTGTITINSLKIR
jgi:hypothetical protein